MTPTSSKNQKILLIEDEFVTIFLLKTAYEKHGFEVVAIGKTAQEAVQLATEHTDIAFISMDIYLDSDGTGIDAAKTIRAQGIETPILFISANIDLQIQTACISKSSFVEKPVDVSALLKQIIDLTQ